MQLFWKFQFSKYGGGSTCCSGWVQLEFLACCSTDGAQFIVFLVFLPKLSLFIWFEHRQYVIFDDLSCEFGCDLGIMKLGAALEIVWPRSSRGTWCISHQGCCTSPWISRTRIYIRFIYGNRPNRHFLFARGFWFATGLRGFNPECRSGSLAIHTARQVLWMIGWGQGRPYRWSWILSRSQCTEVIVLVCIESGVTFSSWIREGVAKILTVLRPYNMI